MSSPHVAMWRSVSPPIISLKFPFCARDEFDDHADSSPRDLCRSARIQRSSRRHASCKGKTVWEHSPTRKKKRKITRLNRGTDSPINIVLSPSISSHTWRPTRRPRGPVRVASYHASAPPAPRAGHPGSAMWP